MIQHLISFASEDAAATALAQFKLVTTDKAGLPQWAENVCLNHGGSRPTQSRVVLEKAEYRDSTELDAKPGEREISKAEVLAAGWQCIVSFPDLHDGLQKLPDNALRLAWDGDTGEVLYRARNVTDEFMSTAIVEPMFLGAKSPFTSGRV